MTMLKQLRGSFSTRKMILPLFVGSSLCTVAQDFPGYRAGNYSGVNSVFFNPANIADSRYRFDVNLFSINVMAGNDQASFKLKDLTKSFNSDSLENQLYGKDAGTTNGTMSVNVVGPSVLFNVKKNAFAITTRARVMANVQEMDGQLLSQLLDDHDATDLPYSINSNKNMRISMNAWTEFGASWGRVLYDKGNHFLKGGITLKYLAGTANTYIQIKDLQATINDDEIKNDAYLANTSGRIGLGFGGASFDDFEASDLTSFESSGFGADIGFVYEFRPQEAGNRRTDNYEWRKDVNKYKFRAGLALIDVGSIKYKRDITRSGAYDFDITGAERLYLSELGNEDLDDYKGYFDKHPEYFNEVTGSADASYKMALPTTLQIDLDYHIIRGLYVGAAGQLSLVSTESKPYNSQYYNSFAVTPRYEGRSYGIYLPLHYSQLTNFNAGASFRYGPLFIGSGSILTAALGKSKQADAHIGIHIYGLQKNKTKKKKVAKARVEDPAPATTTTP